MDQLIDNNNSNLNICSYNCKGLRSSCGLVDNLLDTKCDIMFLCEHWLTVHELTVFNNHFRVKITGVSLKSSMDLETV